MAEILSVRFRCRCGRIGKANREHFGPGLRCGACRKSESMTKHGESQSPEYAAWKSMKRRNRDRVCSRWLVYRDFREDVGPRPVGDRVIFTRFPSCERFEPGSAGWVVVRESSDPGTQRWVEGKLEEVRR